MDCIAHDTRFIQQDVIYFPHTCPEALMSAQYHFAPQLQSQNNQGPQCNYKESYSSLKTTRKGQLLLCELEA